MSETIIVADTPTRQPRQAAERVLTDAEPTVAVTAAEEPTSGPTPEQALAEAQAALRQRDEQIARERDGRTRAEREAARANAGRATDRSAAVAGALEAAKSAKESAKAALRAAREAGDIDAETAALEAFNQATFRETSASAELATMPKADPTSAAGDVRQPAQQGGGYSPAAQAWINSHPNFNTNAGYKAAILAAHGSALADGIAPDTTAYFRELDRVAAALDRGSEDGNKGNGHMPNDRGGFNGAPPARGDQPSASAGNAVQTRLGPVQVSTRSNGDVQVKVPPALMADFEEGAKVCGMKLGDYIYEQVKIAREMAAGGNGGLTIVEGMTYR